MADFKREERYLVLKYADIEEYLPEEWKRELDIIVDKIEEGRGKEITQYVCVAEDWPMYEDVWKAIERWIHYQQIAEEHPELVDAAQRFNELLQQLGEQK